jgi:beta-galactosidase/beta-glucuronidase
VRPLNSSTALEQADYPRPGLARPDWTSLNGTWEFAIDPDARWATPSEVTWQETIRVPFAPETEASGVQRDGFFSCCWYRRLIDAPVLSAGERLFVHFGAVDYQASVWVNGCLAATHEGGYTPFQVDITPLLVPGAQTIVVRAFDDPLDLTKPRGKQDWQETPHSIWYPRTTGIWQTVWMERVPMTSIASLQWLSNLERWEIGVDVQIDGRERHGPLQLRVMLRARDQVLADDVYLAPGADLHRRITLSDPGIDDYRNELLWSPSHPTLIDAEVELRTPEGEVLDRVTSYTALRSVSVQGDRFLLNGRPYRLRMVLDQGYWAETGMTAPNDDALRRDVELAKQMGFNGVRKHQKIEDPRYLYWADRLGLLVWEEMPSAYRFTKRSIERLLTEWTAVIDRDRSHPCIVAWVPFNESWGVPDLPFIESQRHYVQALYHLTHTLDPDRPVIGNDGWESLATDIVGIHDYDADPERIARRYETEEVIPRLFQRERPGGRQLTVEGYPHAGQPIMLTEFGGISYPITEENKTWGYSVAHDPEDLARRYTNLLEVVRALPLLAGFCYTQFTDTFQEANGLLYVDRTPKFPIEQIAQATRRYRSSIEAFLEHDWQGQLLGLSLKDGKLL